MIDFLLLRRAMLVDGGGGTPLVPIDNRYFIAFLVGGVVYISGIKFENWAADYPPGPNGVTDIIIPDTIEVDGVSYPTIIDSEPYYKEGMEV